MTAIPAAAGKIHAPLERRGRKAHAASRAGVCNNLDVQTRVIAHSRCFIGTYGGLSYLAPFLGKPSVAFHDGRKQLLDAHVNTAATIFRGLGAPFALLTPKDADLLNEIL